MITRRWRLFAIAMVGAGFALFLRLHIGALEQVQAVFGATPAWFETLAAFAGSFITWRLEMRIRRMAFGEAAILIWFSSMCLAILAQRAGVSGVPMTAFSLAMLGSTFGLYAARSVFEEDNRKHLAAAFKSYVSPELVEELEKNPERLNAGSERKELTIFFSDIQNFTRLSEKLEPEELMNVLNRYFSGVTEIVFRYGGTLDKYMGDGVMAFWGAPAESMNHQKLAALAARDVDKFSRAFFSELAQRTGIPLSTRIGLNSGVAHVGNFGSPMRFTYTVLGDEANLAARLEPLNQRYGTQILISGSTAEKCGEFSLILVDEVVVKGRTKPVKLYAILENDEAQLKASYARAFELYQRGQFNEAASAFSQIDWPAAKELEQRAREFGHTPPGNWDGFFRLNDKK